MLFAFEFLLVRELPARCRHLVLRLDMRGIGADRLGVRLVAGGRGRAGQRPADTPDLDARHEAFQIALLLVAEIAGAGGCLKFHDDAARLYSAAAWTIEAVAAIGSRAGL